MCNITNKAGSQLNDIIKMQVGMLHLSFMGFVEHPECPLLPLNSYLLKAYNILNSSINE